MYLENELLHKGPFSKKQQVFLRWYDMMLASLTILASVTILFVVPFGAPYYGSYYGNDIDTYITLGIVVGALTLLASSTTLFMRSQDKKESTTQRAMSFPFKFSVWSLVMIWLLTIPWSFMYLADDGPVLHAILGAPLTILFGVLFGAIAWAMAAVPLVLLVRAVHQLIVKKDATMLVPLTLACSILLLGSLIVIGPMAMDLGLPGKVGGFIGMLALLGVPVHEVTIENEAAFLLGRYVLVAALVILVVHLVLKAYFKKKNES